MFIAEKRGLGQEVVKTGHIVAITVDCPVYIACLRAWHHAHTHVRLGRQISPTIKSLWTMFLLHTATSTTLLIPQRDEKTGCMHINVEMQFVCVLVGEWGAGSTPGDERFVAGLTSFRPGEGGSRPLPRTHTPDPQYSMSPPMPRPDQSDKL